MVREEETTVTIIVTVVKGDAVTTAITVAMVREEEITVTTGTVAMARAVLTAITGMVREEEITVTIGIVETVREEEITVTTGAMARTVTIEAVRMADAVMAAVAAIPSQALMQSSRR